MHKRHRSDTIIERVKAVSAGPIDPPSNVKLLKSEMPFFASVIDEFPRSEWTAHQLELAAMLARTMANLDAQQKKLRREGFTVERAGGGCATNPRVQIVNTLSQSVMSFRRSLQLHARAQKGEAKKTAARRALQKEAQDVPADALLA